MYRHGNTPINIPTPIQMSGVEGVLHGSLKKVSIFIQNFLAYLSPERPAEIFLFLLEKSPCYSRQFLTIQNDVNRLVCRQVSCSVQLDTDPSYQLVLAPDVVWWSHVVWWPHVVW